MQQQMNGFPPCRVTDLIALKKDGSTVHCRVAFEILPVDFVDRKNPFQAHIFLVRFSGGIDGQDFEFRKCYARGCPNNLCPHVSQAVMIANRYLQRDYRRLEESGIDIDKRLFTLEDMMVKYEDVHEDNEATMTIDDAVNLAREGNAGIVEVKLEFVPGVEHFANYQKAQMFLMADFSITHLGKPHHMERCLACYPHENEREERSNKIDIANARLARVYEAFDHASIPHEKTFFHS